MRFETSGDFACWRRFKSAYLLTAFRYAYRKHIDREQLFLSGWFEKLGISKKVKGSSGNLNPWIHLLDDEGESFLLELSPVQAFLLIEWTMSKIPSTFYTFFHIPYIQSSPNLPQVSQLFPVLYQTHKMKTPFPANSPCKSSLNLTYSKERTPNNR